MGLKDVGSLDALQGYLLTSPDALHVLFVYADWDAPSQPGGQMHTVTEKLAELHPGVHFAKVRPRHFAERRQQRMHALQL